MDLKRLATCHKDRRFQCARFVTFCRSVYSKARKLAPGGLLILTYRDLSAELYGTDRCLPVQADDKKIMTCFLEYKNDDSVVVNDFVHVREENGWKLNKSSYEKLRLSSKWVSDSLRDAGFAVEREEVAGRLLLTVAQKRD